VLNNGGFTYKYSDAYGINDSGSVVGAAHPPDFTAFYWPGKGSLQDLNTLIPANSGFGYLDSAYGINHAGQIVGYGQLSSGAIQHGFLLTPISGKALTAAALPARAVTQTLSISQATPLLAEAIHRWQAAGVDTSALGNIPIQISNLGGRTLGLADEAQHTIWLDDNAAGWGWFVDQTPWSDSEFTRPGNQGEQTHMDLLTVLEHEVGHLLGKEHAAGGVMQETLAAGQRRNARRGQDALPAGLTTDVAFAQLGVDDQTAGIGNGLFGPRRAKR
jgi:probable HAF family extracellular repeat protein